MSNVNVQLTGGSLQVIDNAASVTRISSVLSAIVAQATAAFYDPYLILGVGNTNLVLPAATCWTLYVRNLHVSQTASVTLTPTGGSAWVSPIVLPPAGMILTMVNYSSNPGQGGFTACVLTASGASTPVELMVAG